MDVTIIKEYFNGIDIPTTPVTLNNCTIIINPLLFLDTHISFVEHSNERLATPYLNRIREFARVIK